MDTKKPIAKDDFEMEYADKIQTAEHWKEARSAFDEGCMLCTLYGRIADCGACPIREALLAEVKWHYIKDQDDILWVRKEMASA